MTSRERVVAALTHKSLDRTPIFEYVMLPDMAGALLGRKCIGYDDPQIWFSAVEELGWEGAISRYAADRLDLAQLLGHDMLYVYPAPIPPKAPAQTVVANMPSDDPVECIDKRNKLSAEWPINIPEDSLMVYARLSEEMCRREMDLPILAPAYLHGVWTDVDLMQTMILEPEVAHQHFALATRRALAWVDQYLALGIDQIGVGGDFAGNKPLISPRAYKEFIVPQIRLLSSRIHQADAWAVNASDGDLWPVIDDFLYGCNVDGYLEIDLHAGMDLGTLKQRFGDRIAFYGNMDCGLTLSFSTPHEIRKQVIDCVLTGWGGGGHVLCASNAITSSIPLVNYVAMVDAYREVFGIPRLSLDHT